MAFIDDVEEAGQISRGALTPNARFIKYAGAGNTEVRDDCLRALTFAYR